MSLLILMAAVAMGLIACSPQAAASRNEPAATFALPHTEDTQEGYVINVIDGVTIEVDIGGQIHTVKYLGVELPDPNLLLGTNDVHEQALSFNRFLVGNKRVRFVRGSVETDSMGHLLRYVYVDGEMANETLVTNGYAVVTDLSQSFDLQTEFLIMQEDAKHNLRGVWENYQNSSQSSQSSPASIETPSKFGGTLPSLPSTSENTQECGFSDTSIPTIKAVTLVSGERVYYLPSDPSYSSVPVDESSGDRLLCTEFDAILGGWSKAE